MVVRLRHIAPAGLLALCAAAPAHAVSLIVTPAQTISADATSPALVATAGGGAVLAMGSDTGVFVSRRTDGAFTAPEKIAPDFARNVRLAANARGDLVVAWDVITGPDEPSTLIRFATAPAGGAFGAPQAVPLPPRAPSVQQNTTANAHGAGLTGLAVAPDGDPVVAFTEVDGAADNLSRAVLVTHGEPRIVATGPLRGPLLAADAAGGLHVAWTRADDPDDPWRRRLFAAYAPPGGDLGAPQVISEPELDADTGFGGVTLAAAPGGDAVALWSPATVNRTLFMTFPDRISAARRPAGGAWGPPTRLTPEGSGAQRPSAAIGPAGHVTVAWYGGLDGLTGRSASPGGPWTPFRGPQLESGTIEETALAADGSGRAVGVVRGGMGNKRDRVLAYVRDPGGCFGPGQQLGSKPTHSVPPAIALAPDGTGAIAWTNGRALLASAITVTSEGPAVECPDDPANPRPKTLDFEVSRLAATSAGTVLRRGVKVVLQSTRPTRFAAVLTIQGPKRRGRRPAPVVADSAQTSYLIGPYALRLHVPKRLHAKVRRGALLRVTVGGADARGGRGLRTRTTSVR